MPGGISSGAGSVPRSAGIAARAGSAFPAQLVTHTSSDTFRGGTGLRVSAEHAVHMQSVSCIPADTTALLSPCPLQEWGEEG